MKKLKKIIFILSTVSLLYGFTNLIYWNLYGENYLIERAENCQIMFEFTSEEYKACAYYGIGKVAREENYGRLFVGIGLVLPLLYLAASTLRKRKTEIKQ